MKGYPLNNDLFVSSVYGPVVENGTVGKLEGKVERGGKKGVLKKLKTGMTMANNIGASSHRWALRMKTRVHTSPDKLKA